MKLIYFTSNSNHHRLEGFRKGSPIAFLDFSNFCANILQICKLLPHEPRVLVQCVGYSLIKNYNNAEEVK